MNQCKKALSLGVVSLLFLMGLLSCFEKPKHYPHFLTSFVEPDTFRLTGEPILYTLGKERLCYIELFDSRRKWILHFDYDGNEARIVDFLASIGDVHYHNRNHYERRAERATGLIIAPSSLVITCDHNYNETLKAGMPINEVASIYFKDHLSFIQNGYKDLSPTARIELKNQGDLKRLLASAPNWALVLESHPEAWNGKTVRFTVTMELPTDKGDKVITNSIDVQFPFPKE